MRYDVYKGVHRHKIKTQQILLAAIALAFTAALTLASVLPARANGGGDEGEHVVVNAASLALNANSWYFFNDVNNQPSTTEDPAHYKFVEGPGQPPMGKGSVQFTNDVEAPAPSNQRWNIASVQFAGTNLKDIEYLKFQTYQPNSNPGDGSDQNAVYLNLDVDFDGSGGNNAYQSRLHFVPRDNGAVLEDTWQLWNAGVSKSKWRWSGFEANGNKWPDNNLNAVRTWNDIKKAFPNAEIHSGYNVPQIGAVPGQLLFRGGEPYPGGFTGSVDKFVYSTAGNKKVFDFEPTLTPATEADCLNKGWKRFNAPVFANQVECIAFVQAANTCFNGFETNTDEWLDNGGTVTRVPSGSDGITSADGAFHAKINGAGPFTRWCGYESVFPTNGYTTQVDIYVDTALALGGNDDRFDFSSAVTNTVGAHRRDFIFHLGTNPSTAGEWFASVSNNSPGWPGNPARSPIAISDSGWYTLKSTFQDDGSGVLEVVMEVIKKSDSSVVGTWTLSDPTDLIGVTVGGNRYGWFVTSDFSFLALDNTKKVDL